jgi:ABC-type dipeptide/oligopeptide/nickel transport system permease subunit
MSTVLFRFGPEGWLLVWALILSVLVAVLAWRRASMTTAGISTLVVALSLVVWQFLALERRSDGIELLDASFIIVPAAVLLGASRVNWLSRHAWVLVLLGPIVFVGCYVGICELCYGLIRTS